MNCVNMFLQMSCLRKWFTTRSTFVIFMAFMDRVYVYLQIFCWTKWLPARFAFLLNCILFVDTLMTIVGIFHAFFKKMLYRVGKLVATVLKLNLFRLLKSNIGTHHKMPIWRKSKLKIQHVLTSHEYDRSSTQCSIFLKITQNDQKLKENVYKSH